MRKGNRSVAQFGSALRSGRRGRGFESRHSDLKALKSAFFLYGQDKNLLITLL